MTESRITLDMANAIIATRRVPIELAKYLGLLAHSGPSTLDFATCTLNNNNSVLGGQCLSPLTVNYITNPNVGSPIHSGMYRSTPGGLGSHSNSGCSSPNPFAGGGGGSPMHQITKGISGLTTGGGSISKGTSLASEVHNHHHHQGVNNNQPLDLTMEFNPSSDCDAFNPHQSTGVGPWHVPPNYYDMNPLNLSSAQPIRIVPTPPASPSLCIIQEEFSNMQPMSATVVINGPPDQLRHISLETTPTNDESLFPHVQHPQICLTDVQGSEITLVGCLSDSSSRAGDSDDSLDISRPTQLMNLQGLVITEPSSDMPSITRGVGRKTSLETEGVSSASSGVQASSSSGNSSKLDTDTNYIRRGSDKSLGFSDDSLSNDSNNLSPSQEPSQSSGFKSSDSHSEAGELLRLSPDSLSENNRVPSDVTYELPLPQGCSNLDSSRILQYVKEAIDSRVPPKGVTMMNNSSGGGVVEGSVGVVGVVASSPVGGVSGSGLDSGGGLRKMSLTDSNNLNLEYSGGLHIELQVCEGKGVRDGRVGGASGSGASGNKGTIKLRRISGDQFEYGKLCQQLISSLRV